MLLLLPGVESGLLVKALHCGSKGPGFQSHLQQRFISLLGALSPTPKMSRRFPFVFFGGDRHLAVGPGEPLKISLSAIGSFLVSWVIRSKPTCKNYHLLFTQCCGWCWGDGHFPGEQLLPSPFLPPSPSPLHLSLPSPGRKKQRGV